jgi:thymidine kinase
MAKLYFYYSAMNAGKSTTLLQASYNYLERGMQTLLFAPKIDTRFETTLVYSRIGLKKDAIPFSNTFDFFTFIEEKKNIMNNLKCILVDEAHFLTKAQVAQLTEVATELSLPVLCYGLRSDFLAEPFEGSKYLLAWAEELIEIKTICNCGRKATMNMRIDANGNPVTAGNQVQIGGNESYVSQCMKCYKQSIKEFKTYAEVANDLEK